MGHENEAIEDAVRRVQRGDVERYAVIVNTFNHRISMEIARRAPWRDVEELTQDVFVRAYRALPSFSHRGPFEAWLLQIARRTCQDFWRRRYRSRVRYESELTDSQQAWIQQVAAERSGREAEAAEQREMTLQVLEKAMNRLTPDDRVLIALLEMENRSIRETAAHLKCSETALRVRAFRARHRLRNILLEMIGQGSEDDE